MKKIGILNRDISDVIAGMGHRDMLVVCDAGLPIPANVRRIDLALREGLPAFLDTVEVLSAELEVERMILAAETAAYSPHIQEGLLGLFDGAELETISHERLKELTKEAVAVIRTGEFTPYANVILVSGVIF